MPYIELPELFRRVALSVTIKFVGFSISNLVLTDLAILLANFPTKSQVYLYPRLNLSLYFISHC